MLNGIIAERNIARLVKNTVEKAFHRNGQMREVVPLRNGRRHGVVRTLPQSCVGGATEDMVFAHIFFTA